MKTIDQLKALLADFEQDVSESITAELMRICMPVPISTFSYNPFREEVAYYMDSIGLDAQGNILIKTSFRDVKEKYLREILSDSEIDHWSLIGLLDMLSEVPSADDPP